MGRVDNSSIQGWSKDAICKSRLSSMFKVQGWEKETFLAQGWTASPILETIYKEWDDLFASIWKIVARPWIYPWIVNPIYGPNHILSATSQAGHNSFNYDFLTILKNVQVKNIALGRSIEAEAMNTRMANVNVKVSNTCWLEPMHSIIGAPLWGISCFSNIW